MFFFLSLELELEAQTFIIKSEYVAWEANNSVCAALSVIVSFTASYTGLQPLWAKLANKLTTPSVGLTVIRYTWNQNVEVSRPAVTSFSIPF